VRDRALDARAREDIDASEEEQSNAVRRAFEGSLGGDALGGGV